MLRRQTRTVGRFRYEVMLPEQVNGDEIDASMDAAYCACGCRSRRTDSAGASR